MQTKIQIIPDPKFKPLKRLRRRRDSNYKIRKEFLLMMAAVLRRPFYFRSIKESQSQLTLQLSELRERVRDIKHKILDLKTKKGKTKEIQLLEKEKETLTLSIEGLEVLLGLSPVNITKKGYTQVDIVIDVTKAVLEKKRMSYKEAIKKLKKVDLPSASKNYTHVDAKILSSVYLARAKIYQQCGMTREAIDDLENHMQVWEHKDLDNPKDYDNFIDASMRLVELYKVSRIRAERIDVMQRTLKRLKPDDEFNHYAMLHCLGRIYALSHDYSTRNDAKALEILLDTQKLRDKLKDRTKIIKKVGGMNLKYDIGMVLMELHRYGEAISYFRNCQSEDKYFPDDQTRVYNQVQTLGNMGLCFFQLGNIKHAMKNTNKCIQLIRMNFQFSVTEDGEEQMWHWYQLAAPMCLLLFSLKSKILSTSIGDPLKSTFEPEYDLPKVYDSLSWMPINYIIAPHLLNLISANWKLLSYAYDKKKKKNWRRFKNSTLMVVHFRKAFQVNV